MSTTYNEAAPAAAPTNSTARVATASIVGTAIEFYDFYIYATAAALVIGPVFLRYRADAGVVPDLRYRLHRPSAGLGTVRPLWRPHRA
jgi:hypothetical protein